MFWLVGIVLGTRGGHQGCLRDCTGCEQSKRTGHHLHRHPTGPVHPGAGRIQPGSHKSGK